MPVGFEAIVPGFRCWIMTLMTLSLQTETALMYDAALLFATALGELDRSQDIETAVLSCDSELTWQHGNSLINYMKLVSMQGVIVKLRSRARSGEGQVKVR